MFINNTSKAVAMSDTTSQTFPLDTPELNGSHKRRRSQELTQSERSASSHDAEQPNGTCFPASKEDAKRRSSDATNDNQEMRGDRRDKRQRIRGALDLVRNNITQGPHDQQEAREQLAQTAESPDTGPALLKEDRTCLDIVTSPPEVFGVVSLRPEAYPSFKPSEHLALPQSPLVSRESIARSSPPSTLYQPFGGGFDGLSSGEEDFQHKFVHTKEKPFGAPNVCTTKQATPTQGPRRQRDFEVWKDVPKSYDPRDYKPTAPGQLYGVTNMQKRQVLSRRVSAETSLEPAFAVKKPQKRMRMEAGERYHADLKGSKFSQGTVPCEQVDENEQNSSTAEAQQHSEHVEEPLSNPAGPSKRKADDDLRENSPQKIKVLGHQPFPSVGSGESQTTPVQDFTSEYFTEYAKPLPPYTQEDKHNAATPDEKHPVIHGGISDPVEARLLPVDMSEPILNDGPFPTVDDSEGQPSPSLEPKYDEPISSFARLASPEPAVISSELPQNQRSFSRDGTTLSELNSHQTPSLAIEAVITPQKASIVIPTIPYWIADCPRYTIAMNVAYSEGYNSEHPREYENYLAQFTARPATSRPREYQYRPMPEMLDVEILNQRLDWVVPNIGEAPRLFRELPIPPHHIDSELTRCVRFAQSDSQRRVDWRVHPSHVAEIIQRTNFHGMELLVSREWMRISSPPTKDEFELAMATRLAHASFGKDPVAYIAADVPALAVYLVENPAAATYLTPNEAEDHFGNFAKYYHVKLAESYPPLSVVGLPAWQLLLAVEQGQPSLKARSLQYIIDFIKEQAGQTLEDGRVLQPPEAAIPYKDPGVRDEILTSYHPDSGLIDNPESGVLGVGSSWTFSGFNASFLSVDCAGLLGDANVGPFAQYSDEGIAEMTPGPNNPGAGGGGAQERITGFPLSDEPWTNQDLSAPWNLGQDDSAPGFDIVSSEIPVTETFLGQGIRVPSDNNDKTDQRL